MGATGFVMFGFAVVHMIGTLQVYLGREALNHYAVALRETKSLIWGMRILLAVSVVAHVTAALTLNRLNRAAGGAVPGTARYAVKKHLRSTYSSRAMLYTGLVLGAFVAYHLAHLTFGVAPHAFTHLKPYDNLVAGFRIWWITLIYLVAQGALGLHLWHGAWALFNSLGLSHPKYDGIRRTAASAVTAAIIAGNVSIPLSVMAGILG